MKFPFPLKKKILYHYTLLTLHNCCICIQIHTKVPDRITLDFLNYTHAVIKTKTTPTRIKKNLPKCFRVFFFSFVFKGPFIKYNRFWFLRLNFKGLTYTHMQQKIFYLTITTVYIQRSCTQ